MKITKNNYFTTVESIGIEKLPVEIREAHQYISELTTGGSDWSRLKTNESFKSIADLAFKKLGDFIKHSKGLNGTPRSNSSILIEDCYYEAKSMETYLSQDGKILTKKEIKSILDELQNAISDKKIRKHSPFAKEILQLQQELVDYYNEKGNAIKIVIEKPFRKRLEAAMLKYFNSRKDLDTGSGAIVQELSGTDKKSETIPSTELAQKEFSCLGFTGKWFNLIGNPSAGFTAMIFGRPKMGKSYLAIDFGGYLAKNFGKVLYVAKEEKFGLTFAKKLEDKNASHENLIIGESIPEDLSPYDFIFLDSVNSLQLKPEDLRSLKESYPEKSFVFVFQTTKTGNFRGENSFQHDVDIVIEIPERGKAVQFGRFNQGGEIPIFDEEKPTEAELDGISDGRKGRYPITADVHMAILKNPQHDQLLYWSSQKALSWDMVRAFEVPDTKLLDRLPLVNEKDYPPIQTPNSELPAELQKKIFILQKNGKYYFIDTQGYDYPRYVLELLNYRLNDETDLGSAKGNKKYPAWTTPKHLTSYDHDTLKRIYDLYKKRDMKLAMDTAMNTDTIVREEIPGDIWKKMGGMLTKTGEEKLKKKKESHKSKEPIIQEKRKTLVFHGGVRTMKEVMERAWDLELNDSQYMEILEIAQEMDSRFVDMMDNLNIEFNSFFAVMKKAMSEWESKNGKLSAVNREKFDPKLYEARSDDENPTYIFSMTSNQVLVDALKGDFDLVYLVRMELANRGLDRNGKWVGFKEAAKLHHIE
jgi:hypothetical protein